MTAADLLPSACAAAGFLALAAGCVSGWRAYRWIVNAAHQEAERVRSANVAGLQLALTQAEKLIPALTLAATPPSRRAPDIPCAPVEIAPTSRERLDTLPEGTAPERDTWEAQPPDGSEVWEEIDSSPSVSGDRPCVPPGVSPMARSVTMLVAHPRKPPGPDSPPGTPP